MFDPSKGVLLSFLVTAFECCQGVLTNLGSFSILLRQVMICCHMPGNLCYFWCSDCSMLTGEFWPGS
ncbi:putative signal peptide protein [Puccinia sorghi]|uniref:Putative signal peptide protein n=1 Tax=Puccinia sorghi TaxID=27349 RepID=A0A0L6VTI9_9BASI|nr:putative signal peptide protein [Puccinia sorghi]